MHSSAAHVLVWLIDQADKIGTPGSRTLAHKLRRVAQDIQYRENPPVYELKVAELVAEHAEGLEGRSYGLGKPQRTDSSNPGAGGGGQSDPKMGALLRLLHVEEQIVRALERPDIKAALEANRLTVQIVEEAGQPVEEPLPRRVLDHVDLGQFETLDLMWDFIDDTFLRISNARVPSSTVHTLHVAWCTHHQVVPLRKNHLGMWLAAHGFRHYRDATVRYWVGLLEKTKVTQTLDKSPSLAAES